MPNHLFTEPMCEHNKAWNCCGECRPQPKIHNISDLIKSFRTEFDMGDNSIDCSLEETDDFLRESVQSLLEKLKVEDRESYIQGLYFKGVEEGLRQCAREQNDKIKKMLE